MKQYLDLLEHVLNHGVKKGDRTGTGTLSVFGYQMRFDLSQGFPLVTTKKTWFKGVKYELLWFLQGDTNIKWLKDNRIRIWDAWANKHGDLGPVYGHQWRRWGYRFVDVETGAGVNPYNPDFDEVDQIYHLIQDLKDNPDSRRHIVSAWNPMDIPYMALAPCHCLFQFYVADGKLSCQLYQRSADIMLGVPFNIASYALLTHMVAQVCDLEVGDFVHTFGDAHIYLNHVDLVKRQLTRKPHPLPTLWLNPEIKDIDDFKPEDIEVQNYTHDSAIIAPIAVSKDMERKIGLVVAMGENGVIGSNGSLPAWKLRRDMVRFRRKTIGRPVIMGRKTHESIGMTLPDRRNIVLTRRENYTPFEGSEVASSLEEALELCKDYPETMIIGGGEIYKMAMPLVDNLYVTIVHGDFEGDVTFEVEGEWEKTWEKKFSVDEWNSHDCTFIDYVRNQDPEAS